MEGPCGRGDGSLQCQAACGSDGVETLPAGSAFVKIMVPAQQGHGKSQTLIGSGGIQSPTNARRSFEPQYGPAHNVASVDSMVVRATEGTETLLKHALPSEEHLVALLDQWSPQWKWRGRQRSIGGGRPPRGLEIVGSDDVIRFALHQLGDDLVLHALRAAARCHEPGIRHQGPPM